MVKKGIGGTVAAGVEGGNCDGGCGPENGGNGLSGGDCAGEGVNGGSGCVSRCKEITRCRRITWDVARHVRTSWCHGTHRDPNPEVVQVVHQQCQV